MGSSIAHACRSCCFEATIKSRFVLLTVKLYVMHNTAYTCTRSGVLLAQLALVSSVIFVNKTNGM